LLAHRIPTAGKLIFYTGAITFSFMWLLIYPHETEWTTFQVHSYTENPVAPEIEPGTTGSVISRPQKGCHIPPYYIIAWY
jgi:hypothetical protein